MTVRLPPELATWLRDASVKTGVAQGEVIRKQLEKPGQAATFARP